MKRKLVITYNNPDNDKKTKTISNANPTATNETLEDFVEDAISNLTTNTIIKTQKVDTTDLGGDDNG